MSDQNAQNPTLASNLDLSALGDAIGQGIRKSQRARLTFGEYEARGGASPYHKGVPAKLKRVCFQNGYYLSTDNLNDREIELLNKITHSGRYVDREVEIQLEQNGSEETLYIRWKCGTADQRSEFKGKVRNFTDLLQQVVEAQEYERLEAEEVKEHKAEQRRKFGEGKATREARERAGVV